MSIRGAVGPLRGDASWGDEGRAIDVHSHIVPPAYVRAIAAAAEADAEFASLAIRNHLLPPQGRPEPARALTDIDLRLADMDRAGVAISAISVPPPGPLLGDRDAAIRANAETNDGLIEIAERHPDRLRVLAAIPLPYVEAALAEIERVRAHPLVRGVELMTVGATWTLDEARLEAVYARLAELGLVVLLHPALEPTPVALGEFGLVASVAPVLSSSVGALRLVLSGMLDRVPGLDVVVPHLGGVIPYLSRRIIDLSGQAEAQHTIDHYLGERLYLDTCSFHPPALECALGTTPARRLLLGSDAPFRGGLARAVDDVRTSVIPVGDRAAVLGATASRWFG